MNPFDLKNKTIIVTGASSGIGRQCAISCSQMGAKVVLVARNEDRLKETGSLLKGEGHLYYPMDITKFEEIEFIVKDSVEHIGKLSGFIHSAGVEQTLPLKMMKPANYNNMFNINVTAGFEFARIISKKKYRADSSSLVFISSIMSMVGNAGLTGYCASKGALVSGTRAMSIELAKDNVRVNCISPGHVYTEMMQKALLNISEEQKAELNKNYLLGIGKPEDVANASIYLLSDASKWVTGTNLIVDGGYSAR